MKELLFKAKRIDNREWVEGFLFHCLNNGEEWCIGKEPLSANDYSEIIGEYRTWFAIDENTICQFTGLYDKNGNKIWKNDIVKKHFYTDYDAYANSEEYIGVVKFVDCAWVIETIKDNRVCTRPIFESMAYSKDVEYFEVIGNIFDNPELLEGGAE